ncbi:MAG TPA: hypothetical protein VFN89_08840 [Solirubrobacterales bacterium]|nr:hypothetical protein [Solirubrobacterales bacterium]
MQAALVALPGARRLAWLEELRSRWWALVPAGSIVVVIGIVAWEGESATALSWLALVAVPPFAALALGWLVHGSRPEWAAAIAPLFAIAWATQGSLLGEAAATALTGLGCVGLGWLLVSVAPGRWLSWGIYAMAAVDTLFVVADLLQGPNAVLTAAAPSGLPRLQAIHFGAALMGFGDFFIAATLGCLLAISARRQLLGALLVAVLGLAFDLLFFAVDTLPATVPVALALGLLQLRDRRV